MAGVERIMAGEGSSTPETGAVATAETHPLNQTQPLEVKPANAIQVIPVPDHLLQAENVTTAPDQSPIDQPSTTEAQISQDGSAISPPGGHGGEGRDSGDHEGPPGPRSPDYIWSPEFRREGRRIARAILRLEALSNQEKYNAQNGPRLNRLYLEWKAWYVQKKRQSDEGRPFEENKAPPVAELGDADYTEEELRAAVEYDEEATVGQQPSGERDLLLDEAGNPLLSLKDRRDEEGTVTKGLLTRYKRLRKERAAEDQIRQVEEQLGRYFREAKRLGLLTAVDDSLGPVYKRLKDGMIKKEVPSSTLWRTEVRRVQREISQMGKDFFEMELEAGVHSQEELNRVEGVWDVYATIAIERFQALLSKKRETRARPTINGAYNFNIDEVTFSTQTGEEGLRRFLPTDAELRELVERDITTEGRILSGEEELLRQETEEVLRRLADGVDEQFQALVDNRNEAYRRLFQDREVRYRRNIAERQEATRNLVRDRDAYRQLAIDRELYWSPTYANYYEVYAETEEQFQKAVDTFTQWLRSGLTKSPNELFQRVSGFKDALTTAGLRASMDTDFMIGLRQELEAMVGVLGANIANEEYNPDYMKQFLDFVSANEGPARYVRLGRAYRGKISALLWKFDNDPELELFFATYGSRGQLFEERNPVELHGLRKQIRDKLVEEMLGVDIKGYDPVDPDRRVAKKYLEQNLKDLSRFQSDEETKNLFEGFNQQDQESYYNDERFQRRLQRIERVKGIEQQVKEGRRLNSLELTPEEKADYLRYKNGRLKLTEYEDRLVKAVRIRDLLDRGLEPEDLKGVDKALYEMYMETSNAVDLVIELYGVTGEKSKRRGGIYIVDRRDAQGRLFVDYIPNNRAEQVSQFVENWVKATYGTSGYENELDPEIQAKLQQEKRSPNPIRGIPADELKYRVDQARRMAMWAVKIYGHDAKLWDFTLLQNGKPADPNTLGYSGDHQDTKTGNKNGNLILFGADRTKNPEQEKVDYYRYCVPENPRILGYNSRGEEVILVFDDQGKPVEDGANDLKTGLLFGEDGKAIIFDKLSNGNSIIFDNLDRNTQARPMLLKTPRLRLNSDGSVYFPIVEIPQDDGTVDRAYSKPIVEGVDLVHADFQTAIKHVYSRWTGHPYWGYQEEDTGLILSRESFEAAKKIKRGELRWEDAPAHAVQLLIVDPTLERAAHFKHKESREDKIMLALVEESYQGHWRIRDELNQIFLPDGPDVESARTAFILQDDGGSTKQWENLVFESSRWPNMKLRRSRNLAPVLPLHFAPKSDMWAAGGVLNVLRMHAYSEYKMVGLFATQKWDAQTKGAQDQYQALFGFVSEQEHRSREGVGEKFTNDSDRLDKMIKQLYATFYKNGYYNPEAGSEDVDNEFLNLVRETLNRFEITMHTGRVLETDMRGERAPIWFEGVDIFERNPDGSIKVVDGQRVYNQKVDENRDSGSSRHSDTIWFWRGVRWLVSNKHWEGVETYPGQASFYDFMNQYTYESIRAVAEKRPGARLQTHWEWLLGKIVR